MTIHIRKCQGCKEERSEEEALCGNCGWNLTLEPLRLPGQIDFIPETPITPPIIRHCLNGHSLDQGDEMCFECGAAEAIAGECSETPQLNETVIDGWAAIDQLESHSEAFEIFIVERHGHRALLTFYLPDTHPDSTIYEVLKRLPKDYVPELLAYGEWQGRRYEVTDFISQSNLLNLASASPDLETIRQIVKSMGRILSTLTENGLRHGNLRPENILISHRDPLSLLLTGFQFSRLSTFDLDTVTQPISARYTAPEVIAGGISVASDWWSLGMVILQLITNDQCFDGINEKAFRIHVVTRGVSLPKGIDPSLNLLLRGLLARDPDQRWQWTKVQSWLAGEPVEAPSLINSEETQSGPALDFNKHSYACPKAYALAAAEATNWVQAKDLLMRGVIATWLEDRKIDPKVISGVRLAASIDSIPDDFRHALALMWMNPNLPLIYQGEIVTSSWLLQNPIQGYEIITSSLIAQLRQMNREIHLCELHDRIERARERAKILEIELDEESFRVFALTSSRLNLERWWTDRRRLYPGSDHGGLNSLLDRPKITDEELLILLGSAIQQYQSAEQILTYANTIASQAGLTSYEEAIAQQWFDVPRRDLYREIEERTANCSQCGISRVDEWANDFIIQRRISLPRALALLSIPKESWKEPDRLQYVSRILEFFEKRTASLAQRGPLVRMIISKSSSRVDLAGIPGNKPKASSILEHLISRIEARIGLDRVAFENNADLERRLRHLVSHAKTYRRDTGIDSLYLGFPFLVMRDNHLDSVEKKPRIAPILLWPIKIDIESRDRVSILFDRDREEVRLNPALTGLLGAEEVKRWEEAAKGLLGRPSIRTIDVIDAFGSLAEPRERALCILPNSDYKMKAGQRQVVCSAVLFHAEFMGQALGEDLRQMQKKSPSGTGLETALRVNKDPIVSSPQTLIPEKDRYFTMESDPSQEKAVFRARQSPGLLIEGPPGTGKSQTIVNIIGDCIGRKQTVLVVCQKSAALEVLAKRLDAEGLRDRFFYITHVNKDRTSVVQSIRTQIEGLAQSRRAYRSENVEREREALAEKIEKLENEIDKHHGAIHTIDEATGLSYRVLLGQLIDLEDHQTKLIEIPALRRILGDFNQKQLSVIEETCAPISGIWLESSFEGNPLASLKLFSSDTALVNEFITTLFAFIENEKKRDEVNSQSIVSFDVIDPSPHQEWIKSHDKLLMKVDWKNISSWFQLFSPIEQLKGSEIIKHLEELKKRLSILDLNKHDQKLSSKLIDIPSSTIEEWLFLAKKATALNPLCFIQHDSFQKQLEELKQCLSNLEINKHDQKFSSKFIDVPMSTLEEWLSLSRKVTMLNPICFTQNDSLQKELQSLKQRLSSLDLKDQDKTLSSKLVDIPMSTLEEWLSLAQKVITSDSFSSLLNPLHLIRLYRIKSVLSNLNEKTTLESIKLFQNLAEFEKQQRPIREAVLLLLEKTYQGNDASKPIFPKDLYISIDSMIGDLTCIVELQKIVLGLGEDLTLERARQFQGASELEIQIRPIRGNLLKLSERLYQETKQLGLLCLENLRILVEHMLEDLASIVRLKHVLIDLGTDQAFERARQFKNAADLEREQRPLRIEISKLLEALYQENEISKPIFLKDLLSVTDRMTGDLILAQNGIIALLTCPRQEEIESIVKTGLPAYLEFISRYGEAFSRHQARFFSLETLDRLYPFFCEELFKLCQDNIRNNNSNLAELLPLVESLPSLSSYQEFRLQASDLSAEVLKVFAILREKDKQLREYPLEELEGIIRRLIAREARLSWKDRIEQKFPILRLAQKELSRKIQILDESSAKMRKLNQRFLSFNMDVEKIGSSEDWEDLTRLRGPRSRRLREIIERGWDLGLTQLRPVWLMNPDTASQLFPLTAGMFDVIIFDEASQIPIENALPTLYRAKRTVISGDEKQMPPTNVFRKRLDDDEEYGSDDDDLDETVSEAERIELEDTWNRREIKDCSDLLSLGKTVLPRSMLQIHYRSKYRELIAFSNAAFYGNHLSVPVRHPENVIQNIRPIEVVRVDGIYANQTNRDEAEKVVDLLAERWSSPDRPSIGVVTFNSKQVDLIEDILAVRAENDPAFRQALSHERDRQQGGEDMGFFVKNVENVQGDERGMIIFSSTFGRDENGSFRRQFGLLSQTGGERRLNVAITRAREKVILVTSLPINEISEALPKRECPKNPRDYLQAYFDYATKISDGSLETARRSLDIMTSETPSSQMSFNFEKDGFVRSVAAFIKSLGLKPSAIKENDAFGLDFVIEDPEKKLFGIGIECDAHCHPILENARAREVWRPKVLRKEIPHVHRVTSYAWYHRRKEEMERLKQVLEGALGIMLTGTSIKVSSGGRA